jgi:DNA-binding GntR family transcriptional regulator
MWMSIDFTKPEPLYKQVVDNIKQKIRKGVLKPGDRIGSHSDLVREYKVSLITVRKALSELINEKILYSRMGKGTYVADRPRVVDFSEHVNIGLVLRDLNNPFFCRVV